MDDGLQGDGALVLLPCQVLKSGIGFIILYTCLKEVSKTHKQFELAKALLFFKGVVHVRSLGMTTGDLQIENKNVMGHSQCP